MTTETFPNAGAAHAAAVQKPPGTGRRRGTHDTRIAGIALIPALVALITFFIAPIISLIWLSLSKWNGVGSPRFEGVDNFTNVLTDGDFFAAIWNSVFLSVISTAGIIVISLSLAWLVSDGVRGAALYRTLWFLPSVAPAAAVAVFWSLSVQPNTGVVNQFLGIIGLGRAHTWLSDPQAAMYVIAFVIVWHGVGFAFLLLLGAMEEIPVSVHEAARIDGATAWRRFRSLTLPLIRPVLGTVTLLNIVWAFNGFTFVWGITGGGPGNATEVLPILVYKEAFQFGNFGPAAAMSVMGGLILLVIGFVSLRLQRSAED